MNELQHVQDFIHDIQDVSTTSDLNQAFLKVISAFGCDKFSCHSLVNLNNPPPDSIQISIFPEEWIARYRDNEYFKHDIIMKTALSNIGPFLWRDLIISGSYSRCILREAEEFGIKYGMTVPISLPGYYPACINIAGDKHDIAPSAYHALHLCAEHYYFELIRRIGRKKCLFGSQLLTPRETECLAWTAKGKTDYEIGCILSLSARTVNEYMGNIRRKFNVSTRTQAVALAVTGGLVIP